MSYDYLLSREKVFGVKNHKVKDINNINEKGGRWKCDRGHCLAIIIHDIVGVGELIPSRSLMNRLQCRQLSITSCRSTNNEIIPYYYLPTVYSIYFLPSCSGSRLHKTNKYQYCQEHDVLIDRDHNYDDYYLVITGWQLSPNYQYSITTGKT